MNKIKENVTRQLMVIPIEDFADNFEKTEGDEALRNPKESVLRRIKTLFPYLRYFSDLILNHCILTTYIQ